MRKQYYEKKYIKIITLMFFLRCEKRIEILLINIFLVLQLFELQNIYFPCQFYQFRRLPL